MKPDTPQRWTDSALVKLTLLALLTMLLLIPLGMVYSLIQERQGRHESVRREVEDLWSRAQVVNGPVLSLPFLERNPSGCPGNDQESPDCPPRRSTLHALPLELQWSGTVEPEVRYRGIYEVVVYESRLLATGRFKQPDLAVLGVSPDEVLWHEATLALGIPDLRGLRARVRIGWGETEQELRPGTEDASFLGPGLSARVPLEGQPNEIPFSLELHLRGSENLLFVPLGEETHVSLSSPWPSPGFGGSFLPVTREIGPSGFQAHWEVPYFGRSYPQLWRSGSPATEKLCQELAGSAFGVTLVLPADGYQRVERSVKYAALFVGLIFATVFLLEVVSPVRLHAVHYLFVGSALCLFYLLLLACSEHMSFGLAYGVASAATVTVVALYTRAILESPRRALIVLGALGALYGYLYTLLQAEDYALLSGSVGIFCVLALLMFVTRHLDWHTLSFRRQAAPSGRDGVPSLP